MWLCVSDGIFFFFQAEDGIRDKLVTGVQTCALPISRHGGDEFALILPETATEAAQQVARRISERLANDGEQPPLSVSIGAASYPQDGETIDQLLGAADRALYKVKASIGETGSLPSLARGAPSI